MWERSFAGWWNRSRSASTGQVCGCDGIRGVVSVVVAVLVVVLVAVRVVLVVMAVAVVVSVLVTDLLIVFVIIAVGVVMAGNSRGSTCEYLQPKH